MFDFLKKKISDFTGKIKDAIKPKEALEEQQTVEKTTLQPETGQAATGKEKTAEQEIILRETWAIGEKEIAPRAVEEKKKPTKKTKAKVGEKPGEEKIEIAGEARAPEEKIGELKADEKRELKAKTGLFTKISGFLGGKIKISEVETCDFFEEFELSLLEADVQQDAARAIVRELKGRLVGNEIPARDDITEFLKREVKASLSTIMHTTPIDVISLRQRPLKIMFLGPNGAGKTTTIAKLAKFFIKNGRTVILAAGDTFRAASIEQLEAHANRLGVKVVKHNYGSDPAAVAFDAVKAAEAKKIDVVLIDTAGRQETNRNLIEELKKIERVVKPDLKLYVGEAYTGQALLQQATEFDKAIGIDGFILTKIDADTKGGTAISLLYSLKKPIVFVGTGQRYEDLLEFRPEFIIDRII